MSKLQHNESLESLLPDSNPSNSHKRFQVSRRTWILLTFVNSVVLAVTLIVTISLSQILPRIAGSVAHSSESSIQSAPLITQQPDSSEWLTCGGTIDEAIEHGCIFDLMLAAWMHPDCYWHDHYTSAYQKSNLTFFLDQEMTIPYPDAHTGRWPQRYIYSQTSYHTLHCAYTFERQIMAWTSGIKIDSQSWDLPHSKHCVKIVLDRQDPNLGTSRLGQGFPKCGRP